VELIGPVKREDIRVSSFVEICNWFEFSPSGVNSVEGRDHVGKVTDVDQDSVGKGVIELSHKQTSISQVDQVVLGSVVQIGHVVAHGEGSALRGYVNLDILVGVSEGISDTIDNSINAGP